MSMRKWTYSKIKLSLCSILFHYKIAYDPVKQTPHVSPEARFIYPYSPQSYPHEFLIFQIPSLFIPTNTTPWFKYFLQSENTPLAIY